MPSMPKSAALADKGTVSAANSSARSQVIFPMAILL